MKTNISKLCKHHRYTLESKGIDSVSSLIQATGLDLLKAYFVLVELHNRTAADVVREFFTDLPDIVPKILNKLDQPQLHHIGFEVHLIDLLAGDKIWHYGIPVKDMSSVENLHAHLQQRIQNHSAFKLAYEKPVTNPRDASHHTKILNLALGLEMEILTQNLIGESRS